MSDTKAEAPVEIVEAIKALGAQLEKLDHKLVTLDQAVVHQLAEIRSRLDTIETHIAKCEKVYTPEEIQKVVTDINELYQTILGHCNTPSVTAVHISTAAYLFCAMVEIGLLNITCIANRVLLTPYTKTSDIEVKWPRTIRKGAKHVGPMLDLVKGIPLDPQFHARLQLASKDWLPHTTSTDDVWYTRTSFYFHAIRHLRNMSTHRSLALIKQTGTDVAAACSTGPTDGAVVPTIDLPDAGASSGPLASNSRPIPLPVAKYNVWLPYSPALKEFSLHDQGVNLLTFQANDAQQHIGNGYIHVPDTLFLGEVQATATNVQRHLVSMLEALMPRFVPPKKSD